YYDKYFGVKYPMAKLDMVAIPDFEAGAMENFGCITYRETEMLVDAKDGALDLNRILDEDASRTTRAIRAKAETPAEINELFDDIAYGKAGAVIGMVENWVGEDVFRRGVHEYLAAHLYGNAKAEDFWDAQTRVSGQAVDKVMRSFVEQPGVPEVTLTRAGAGVPVMQSRFSLSEPSAVAKEAWTIPICFTGASCRLLAPGVAAMDAPVPAAGHPFVFANAGEKGYYRTEYGAPLLAA